MEAIELIINLLEKVSVLVATALFLVLMRPAEVWLTERGHRASPRRRMLLIVVLAPVAIWGIFLGLKLNGTAFDIRAVGIIVAAYLGGRAVGSIVGVITGLVYVFMIPDEHASYVFLASVIDGLLAGYWAKRYGAHLMVATFGAVVVQVAHHVILGAVLATYASAQALEIASNVSLHTAKIGANAMGVLLVMGVFNLTRDLNLARQDAVDSRAQVRQAKLEALQYQLQPHFVFNLLNTLAYLIRTNPVRARSLTLELSEFLRYTLTRQEQETSLLDELRQIERYVELERARFGEGLMFSVRADTQELTSQLDVPPMILQPLVENAIRHGIVDGVVDVCVRVHRTKDGAVHIRVLDNGPGVPIVDDKSTKRLERRQGVGLQNVRERLERYFDGHATLTLEARDDGLPGAQALIVVDAHAARLPSLTLTEQAKEQLRKVVLHDVD